MNFKKQAIKKSVDRKISLIQLIGLAFAFFCSIRNIPQVAQGGISSIVWMILTILIFVIPIGFITTELATGWSIRGGPVIWAKEAFNKKWGFIIGWLLWVQMFLGMTIMLVVFATMVAYIGGNPVVDSFILNKKVVLSNEPFFILCLSIGIYWIITLLNLYFKASGKSLTNLGSIIGIYLPFIVLFICGIAFIGQQASLGNWQAIDNLKPEFIHPSTTNGVLPENLNGLQLFSQTLWIFIGLEITSTRANEIDNPKRNYPIALLIVLVLMVVIIFATGFIFAAIIPYDEITLQSAVILPFNKIFNTWNISWMVNIMAICLAIGTFTHLNSWVLGPSNAMYASAIEGSLPPIFQKTNKINAPVTFMIIQAIAINIFSLLYFILDFFGASNSFGILLNETIIIYCFAYLIMIASFIKLKYSKPNVPRSFVVPGNKKGAWFFVILGVIGIATAMIMTFFQDQNTLALYLIQNIAIYIGISAILFIIPICITSSKKFKNNQWLIKIQTISQ